MNGWGDRCEDSAQRTRRKRSSARIGLSQGAVAVRLLGAVEKPT